MYQCPVQPVQHYRYVCYLCLRVLTWDLSAIDRPDIAGTSNITYTASQDNPFQGHFTANTRLSTTSPPPHHPQTQAAKTLCMLYTCSLVLVSFLSVLSPRSGQR